MSSALDTRRPPACPVCQGGTRSMGMKAGFELSACKRCGAIAVDPSGAEKQLKEMYDHYYDQASFEMTATVEAGLERVVRSAKAYFSTGRWLDVGYGEGGLLSVAERHGWTCYGLELSPGVLEYGGARGWIVTSDARNDPRFAAGSFDVVTMIEFLEHAARPHPFLHEAAQWLRPGGLLYLTTPNAASLNRRILGSDWSIFTPPEHVVIWTRRALDHALRASGFSVARVRTEGCNPSEIVRRMKGHEPNPTADGDRNRSGRALSEALSRTRSRRILKTAINEGLNVLGLGDTIKVWAVRAG